MRKKQTFENYQDYLNSEKWKQVKEEFRNKYGFNEGYVCDISGEFIEDSSDMFYIHVKYLKNWENDRANNIVLVSRKVCNFISSEDFAMYRTTEIPENRKGYIRAVQRMYLNYLKDNLEYQTISNDEKLICELKEENENLKVVNEFLMSKLIKLSKNNFS